ncbi:MAG: fluoride efflux transporter CrcB [Sciscionella sp.]
MTALMIAIGAAVGAPLRYLTDRATQRRHETIFPWGTLTVNLIASFGLALVTAAGLHHLLPAFVVSLIGTGLCASLSTYSTFSYETFRLIEDGAHFYATANVVISLVAGLGAAAFGWTMGTTLL